MNQIGTSKLVDSVGHLSDFARGPAGKRLGWTSATWSQQPLTSLLAARLAIPLTNEATHLTTIHIASQTQCYIQETRRPFS